MKAIKFLTLALVASLLFISCDDDAPDEVNEEELITQVIVTLVPVGAGDTVTMTATDLDGEEGPNPPVYDVSGPLAAGVSYSGTVEFWNTTEDPAEDITIEIGEEDDEHQVFYIPNGTLDVTVDYEDMDANNNPVGLDFTVNAGVVSDGTLNVVLRHEPNKPNDGTLADAGGSTDIDVTFDVEVQ
ncbi:type 1 periplasmic binding fold superfamily protein [Urechidicola sp. KH5]